MIPFDLAEPSSLAEAVRVLGGGDPSVRPIAGGTRTNWDLSAARAIAVVQYLISKGMSPQRLVAAGFGSSSRLIRAARRTPIAATGASS